LYFADGAIVGEDSTNNNIKAGLFVNYRFYRAVNSLDFNISQPIITMLCLLYEIEDKLTDFGFSVWFSNVFLIFV
jgi:hypothetical protein